MAAAASQIRQVVSSIPFPFNIAAIPVGLASLYGAYAGAKSLFGFQVGGHTGSGADDEVAGVVHRNEVVLEAGIVRGQVGDVLALRSLLQSGVSAADLVALAGGESLGDLAAATASATPSPVAVPTPVQSGARELDLSGIEREFARIADEAGSHEGRAAAALHRPQGVACRAGGRQRRPLADVRPLVSVASK